MKVNPHLRDAPRTQIQEGRARRLAAALAFGLALVAAGVASVRGAQVPNGRLTGVVSAVVTAGHSLAVEGARVELVGAMPGLPSLSTFTNQNGEYWFENLPAGSYTLTAAGQNFTTVTQQVIIAAGATVVENIRLELRGARQQIEVHEQAPKVSEQPAAPPATLSAPQLLTVPTPQQAYKEAMPHMASVIRAQNEKLYIKGLAENQGMLMVDSAEAVDPVTGSFIIDIPIDAIQSLDIFKTPFQPENGGFSGGLTSIETKAPGSQWHLTMNDLNPSIRGKQGHIVGFARAEPRIYFGGPLLDGKLTFSEGFLYEMRKEEVRGLAWPHDETHTQGFNSYTTLQYLFSSKHLATLNVNIFPRREQFANINALVPQSASSDRGQRGFAIGATDRFELATGGVLTSLLQYTRVPSYAHSQGSEDMLVTPNGLGGNYFNDWTRTANQLQAGETYEFPTWDHLGKHSLKLGAEFLHRDFVGNSLSRPVLLERANGSAAERIDFSGPGQISARDNQFASYLGDHWALRDRLALDLGLRYSGQSLGEWADFAPRLGLVYALDPVGKTVFRSGFGLFHDRVPLLAGDFTANPERIVSQFDDQGVLVGRPVAFSNVCAQKSPSGPRLLASCSDLGSTPYNLTWRLELDREISHAVSLRFSYISSRTFNSFVIDPVTLSESAPMLLLSNRGNSRYHEYEFSMRAHPSERSDLTVSYLHSRSRGDLNTVADFFVPFEQPVIRPNLYGNLPSDVPDRLTSLGTFKLPWSFTIATATDLHSGFPFSNVDVLQNYVGLPNSLRFPIFFSFDWRVYRDFPLPFGIHKGHKFRLGVYSVDTTGRQNPHDVYNSTASPFFGRFTGLGKRINGIVIGFAN